VDRTMRLTFLSKARAKRRIGDRTSAQRAVTVAGLCRTRTGFAITPFGCAGADGPVVEPKCTTRPGPRAGTRSGISAR